MFFKVKELLPKVITRLGIKKEAEASLVINLWPKIACEALDKDLCLKTKATVFKNKTLFVEVENSSLASECFQCSNQLIKKFDQKLGKDKVQKIRFRIRNQEKI